MKQHWAAGQLFALIGSTWVFVCTGMAASPELKDVQPRVWQLGAKAVVDIQGSGLTGRVQLLATPLLGPIVAQEGSDSRRHFEFDVPPDLLPGTYLIWAVSDRGVSNPMAIRLTSWPVQPWGSAVAGLPVALTGRLEGGAILKTQFPGQAGQRVVLDFESRRWGSNLRPVIRLLNSRGAQVAYSQGQASLSGDARLETTLPEDGLYTIVVHDLVYRAPAPGHFVLHVGDTATAQGIYPVALHRGSDREVRFWGGSLHGQTTRVTIGEAFPHVALPFPSRSQRSDWVLQPLPLFVTHTRQWTEEELAEEPRRLPSIPCGVTGCLSAPAEADRYVVAVSGKSRLRVEVFGERVGSPMDGVLTVRRENGQEVARGDDQPQSPDPVVEFTVPDDVSSVIISVEDLLRRGGPEFVYRVEVEDVSQPTVELSIDSQHVTVPVGGAALVKINARRRSYDGPIELNWESLPPGIRVTGNLLAPSNDIGLVVLSAAERVEPAVTAISGRLAQPTERATYVHAPDPVRARHHPWNQWPIAVAAGEPSPVRVVWQPGEQDVLRKDKPLAARVRVERANGVEGKVRVRLVTSQPMPRKKVKENNQEKEVDDVEKALRLEKDVVLDKDTHEVDVQVITPADLAEHPWTLVIAADLLAADEKTVLATGYSDARVLNVER